MDVAKQEAGAGPLIQADLRDNPKQTAIRAGNIRLFYPMPTASSNPLSRRWIKNLMLAGGSPLSALAEKGIGDKAPLSKARSLPGFEWASLNQLRWGGVRRPG